MQRRRQPPRWVSVKTRPTAYAAKCLRRLVNWWARLNHLAAASQISPALQRAHYLLQDWLARADKLPVHDLLDHIYFSADLHHRYAAALPEAMRATVQANLQALLEVALAVDGGRYPSLPGFLAELRELRAAENESPDEGKVGEVGNALRIYTVHEAKGLEAPIVWLLDANDTRGRNDGYGVLLDWPTNAARPVHFSLYSTQAAHGRTRLPLFEAEENYARREGMNLLYVAITRAKQALLVSGNGKNAETEEKKSELSWYDHIAQLNRPPTTYCCKRHVIILNIIIMLLLIWILPCSAPCPPASAPQASPSNSAAAPGCTPCCSS